MRCKCFTKALACLFRKKIVTLPTKIHQKEKFERELGLNLFTLLYNYSLAVFIL